MQVYSYIVLDGHKYAVAQNTYTRKWARYFNSEPTSGFFRLNFIDNGAGVKYYNMTLQLQTWTSDSLPYQQGVTETIEQQVANLEATYLRIATALSFLDPLGNPPNIATGVYFTQHVESIPKWSTTQKPYILVDIELIEAAGVTVHS